MVLLTGKPAPLAPTKVSQCCCWEQTDPFSKSSPWAAKSVPGLGLDPKGNYQDKNV